MESAMFLFRRFLLLILPLFLFISLSAQEMSDISEESIDDKYFDQVSWIMPYILFNTNANAAGLGTEFLRIKFNSFQFFLADISVGFLSKKDDAFSFDGSLLGLGIKKNFGFNRKHELGALSSPFSISVGKTNDELGWVGMFVTKAYYAYRTKEVNIEAGVKIPLIWIRATVSDGSDEKRKRSFERDWDDDGDADPEKGDIVCGDSSSDIYNATIPAQFYLGIAF